MRILLLLLLLLLLWCAVAQLFEAPRSKSEGRGLGSRRSHWDFLLTVAPGSTQPLTEMSITSISGG
jgi:hypothetical protein